MTLLANLRWLKEYVNGCLNSPDQPRHETELYTNVLAVGSRAKIVYAADSAPALFDSSQRQVGLETSTLVLHLPKHLIALYLLFVSLALDNRCLGRRLRVQQTQCLAR